MLNKILTRAGMKCADEIVPFTNSIYNIYNFASKRTFKARVLEHVEHNQKYV